MVGPFIELNYNRHKDKRNRPKKPNSKPLATQEPKNLLQKGMRVRLWLRSGKSFEGTIVKTSTYELQLLCHGSMPIVFKHSIDYAEVLS